MHQTGRRCRPGRPGHGRRRRLVQCGKCLRPAFVQNADTVDHRRAAAHRLGHRSAVADIRQYRFDLTGHPAGAQERSLVGTPNGRPDTPAGQSQTPHDIAPDESRTAKNRRDFCHKAPARKRQPVSIGIDCRQVPSHSNRAAGKRMA